MDNALPGTQSYDFLKKRWNGNLRQVHSLIPLIESMLKDKAVYYMLDFDTFPSPVASTAPSSSSIDRVHVDWIVLHIVLSLLASFFLRLDC